MKRALLLLALAVPACGERPTGQAQPITMTIVDVYEDTATMGCMGTNWVTLLRAGDGRSERLCGKWGRQGDTMSGCWLTGTWDNTLNGFRRICP